MLDRLTLRGTVGSHRAQQNYDRNVTSLSRSMERLGSGLRINRAADDAAGLAISENLAAQVRGLSQAAGNAQDAINLIQTADGALSETTAILQRMRELAVQAGNDTYTQSDRAKIQTEIEQLKLELSRIAEDTEFNGRKLLDGSIAKSRFGFPDGAYLMENPIIGEGADAAPWVKKFEVLFINPASIVDWSMTLVPGNFQGTYPAIGFTLADNAGFVQAASTYNSTHGGRTQDFTSQMPSGWGVRVTYGDAVAVTADIGKTFRLRLDPALGPNTVDRALQMHVGSDAGQTVRIGVQDVSAFGLRLEALSVLGSTESASHARVDHALQSIDSALARINEERTGLGAMQNRLSQTLDELGNAKEQQTISQSRIRDADFARESTKLSRSQILQQSTVSLLAQANTLPEMALKLLDQ